MLIRFIEHHQLFEFIEVYKGYLKEEKAIREQPKREGNTFLHMAISNSAASIASYLLLDTGFDPNILAEDS